MGIVYTWLRVPGGQEGQRPGTGMWWSLHQTSQYGVKRGAGTADSGDVRLFAHFLGFVPTGIWRVLCPMAESSLEG